MKKVYIIIMLAVVFTGCKFEPFTDEGIDVTKANSFVRIDPNDTELTVQEGQTLMVNVESTTAQTENLVINYEVTSDNAVYGVDYTITGATSSGGQVTGSIEIEHEDNPSFYDNADIEVVSLLDGATDGDKTIVITLLGGTSASGAPIDGGQGSINASSTILLSDVDFILDLNGDYGGVDCWPDPANPSNWTETATATYDVSDFSGGYYGYAGAPDLPIVMYTKGSAVWADDISYFGGALSFSGIAGSVNLETGVITLNWTEDTGFGNGGTPTECSTVFTPN